MKNILCRKINDKVKVKDKIELEPTFLAQHEDILATHGYYRRRENTALSMDKHFNQTALS